ncbi:hypothetical protein R1sor_007424 [Riccia sorocarpa]|uniref:Uncharacterized protein n=1 Tax=Riccia sorocarpa TaxID=122646 RepID=A0ABD3HQR0_9MARC
MRVLDNLDGEDWDKLQLFSTFSIHFTRPELNLKRVRKALALFEGEDQPLLVRQHEFEDWFPFKDEKGHRFYVATCSHPEWRPMFQLINGLLLARRRIRDGFGRLALTVKTYIDGSREFDWGQMILDSLHTEIMFMQKHVQKEKPIRVALTFLGQVLTWLFLYKGLIPVVRPEPPIELPAPPLSPQPPTGVEIESSQVHILGFKPTLLHPTKPRQKILILALDGILCCVRDKQTKYLEVGILGWPILGAGDIWICPRSGLSIFLDQVL